MNVTSKRALCPAYYGDLARRTDEGYVSLKTIADRTDSSMKYGSHCRQSQEGRELIDTVRGKEGGYKLARKPGGVQSRGDTALR